MRRLLLVGAAVATLALLAVTVGGSALAYFATSGSGTASAAVSKLTAPTISAATAAAGATVTVTWGATVPPGSGAVTYSLTRDGGDPAGNCPTPAAPTAVVTCKDSGVPLGEHSYRVTARWKGWTAVSAVKTANVTIGEAIKFTIAGSTATPLTGGAVNLTITAKDVNDKTVTTFTGSHSLVFSGASSSPANNLPTVINASNVATAFGSATALTFTSGVASVSSARNGVLKIYKVGAASITASEGSLTTPVPLELTVGVSATTKFALEAADATPGVGVGNPLTITAQDAYGNLAVGYTGPHNLVFSAAVSATSPNGTLATVASSAAVDVAFGTATAIEFSGGVASADEGDGGTMKLYKSGSIAVKATEGTIVTPTAATVTVTPGAEAKFVLASSTTTPAAATAFNLTITAQDAYGNVATGYAGSHDLVFSTAVSATSPNGTVPTVSDSSGAEVPLGEATAIEFSAGVASGAAGNGGATRLYKSGSTAIKATEEAILTPTAVTVTVAPGVAAKLVLTAATPTPTAAANFNLTTTAQDAYGNTATTYTGAKSITFAGALASPSGALPTVVNSAGTAINFGSATALNFTAGVAAVASSKNGYAKLNKAGATSITATDGTLTTPTPLALTVNTAAANRVAIAEPLVSAGSFGSPCLFTCVITALGNAGTVKADVSITDSVGNTIANIGVVKTITVTATAGGTIVGSPLTVPAAGLAIAPTEFTYTAPASGAFTHTITMASTGYTSATATVSK